MGLHYNTTLQELSLSRNSVLAGGAKRIARALEGSPSLACLDLSGQRFEGLGHRGAEAIATLIRWEGETAFIGADHSTVTVKYIIVLMQRVPSCHKCVIVCLWSVNYLHSDELCILTV